MPDCLAKEQDIALDTVIRLHRNWRDLPFSPSMTDADAQECLRRVWEGLDAAGIATTCRLRRMAEMTENARNDMVNRRILPKDVAENESQGASYITRDGHVAFALGGCEQLCIQTRVAGFDPDEARRLSQDADQMMADRALYAYDERFGYLTSDPTLAGTGMTMEVVLHLQSLCRSGKLPPLEKEIREAGLSITPVSKEANLYLLTNPNTFGMSEEDIFNTVSASALQLIEKEREMRENMLKNGRIFLMDAALRSAGVSVSARIMKKNEFMRLYGEMRLGAALDILHITMDDMDETLYCMQPDALCETAGKEIKGLPEDVFRAEQLRKRMLAITHNEETAL